MTDWPTNMPTPDYRSPDGSVLMYCADCLKLIPLLPDGSVQACVMDAPYGIGLRNGDVDGHRSDRWDGVIGDDDQILGIIVLAWAATLSIPTIAFASPWKPWPGVWRNLIAWDKGGAVGGGGDIRTCLKRSWELIQICRNGPMCGGRAESVWRFPIVPSNTYEHICAKPVALLESLLFKFIQDSATSIDPFMGSGTTGVACVNLGRRFLGVEIDRGYFDTAVARIEKAFETRGDLAARDAKPHQQIGMFAEEK
jgi:DNA modification methylase